MIVGAVGGMRHSLNRAFPLLVIALALACSEAMAEGPRTPSVVLAPDALVNGVPQAEYAARWWQWARRVPPGVQPFQDPTGAQCGLNQDGIVWFLAGTDGTADVTRHCTMPTKTYVFFPIINMIGNSMPGKPLTCVQAKDLVRANNDHLANAEVSIDGEPVRDIERFRIASGCFDSFVWARYLDRPDSYIPAATDGYWLMLRPLPAGVHHIRVRARYDNPGGDLGDLEQDFDYELQVLNPPAKSNRKIDGDIFI